MRTAASIFTEDNKSQNSLKVKKGVYYAGNTDGTF